MRIIFLLGLCAAASAADVMPGRADYDAGGYDAAVKAFAARASAAPPDLAAQYNLGNAYFKSRQLGPAIASYERAFELNPRDSDVRFNLTFALRSEGEDFVPPATPPALFYVFTYLSGRELAGLHWIFFWLTALAAGAALFWSESKKATLFRQILAGAAAGWIFFGAWWAGLNSVFPYDQGVVSSAHAELRHGPGVNFGTAFTVPEGRRVRILGSAGGWLQVGVLKEGVEGWIERDAVELLHGPTHI